MQTIENVRPADDDQLIYKVDASRYYAGAAKSEVTPELCRFQIDNDAKSMITQREELLNEVAS